MKDLKATMSALDAKGIKGSEVQEPPWGLLTKITLPGGGNLGLYQPKHPNGWVVPFFEALCATSAFSAPPR